MTATTGQPADRGATPATMPKSGAEWDGLYASKAEFFSGEPNFSLMEEVREVPPGGKALDVGCGEGADAVWLALQGWAVTGLDVSQVALDRAAARSIHAGVQVQWVCAGLLDAAFPPASFDLVSVHYPALRSSAQRDCERALLEAVAPGGLLLMVYHAGFDGDEAKARGIDPAEYVLPADMIAALLRGNWHISIDTLVPRESPTSGAGHELAHNVILRAQQKPSVATD
ncbi:class I SAM-dependent methyltransferase [Mycobacterium sp. CBMA271]|nr:class I SAM-dependent methyltransferase [Mycobacteroides sp. CBMA 271]